LYGIFSLLGNIDKQLKDYTVLQLEEVKNKNNICKSHNITSITYHEIDYTHHRIIQEPKLSLCHIHYDHNFRRGKKKVIRRKVAGTLQ